MKPHPPVFELPLQLAEGPEAGSPESQSLSWTTAQVPGAQGQPRESKSEQVPSPPRLGAGGHRTELGSTGTRWGRGDGRKPGLQWVEGWGVGRGGRGNLSQII